MEQDMDETTRTAVSVAEVPAEAPRLRYDDGREAVQEELSSTRRTARIVGMLVLGGLERRCAGSSAKGDDHHRSLGVQPMNRIGE